LLSKDAVLCEDLQKDAKQSSSKNCTVNTQKLMTESEKSISDDLLSQIKYCELLFDSDAKYVLDVLNYDFWEMLPAFNVPQNGRWVFAENATTKRAQEIDLDLKLKDLIPIDPIHFYEKYEVPQPEGTTTDNLVGTLGVGGLQALQAILIDPALGADQKKNILVIVFGIDEAKAEQLIDREPKPEAPAETITPEADADNTIDQD
jgi:hypothetical protein